MARVLLFSLLTLSLPQSLASDTELFELISQRLNYMKDVAAYKWVNGLPIEDLQREDVVLRGAVLAGLQRGITTESSRVFFQAQIAAAKEIQNYWFQAWEAGNEPPSAPPDLNNVVRPALLRLGNRIVEVLGPVSASRWEHFNNILQVEGLSDSSRARIFRGLGAIDFYPDQWEQINASGILRVGTTGDYPPCTLQEGNAYSGIDLDLAENLAVYLGLDLVVIPTRWPTLSEDLTAGKFDMAMGGVSITDAR